MHDQIETPGLDEIFGRLETSPITDPGWTRAQPEALKEKELYIYGAGSFGRETFLFLQDCGVEVRGFLDRRARELRTYCGRPVWLPAEAPRAGETAALFAVVMDKTERAAVMEQLRAAGFPEILEAQYYRSLQVTPDDAEGEPSPEYYAERRERITQAYGLLADEKSRRIYTANLNAHLCRDYSACPRWEDPMAEQYFPGDIRLAQGYGRFVDCGGFVGDTIEALLRSGADVRAVASFEPDTDNFRRMSRAGGDRGLERYAFPCAVSDRTELRQFSPARGSGTLCDSGGTSVLSVSLDEAIAGFRPTMIKMDIEGEELRALCGARNLICTHTPDLAVCVYHRTNHLWDALLLLRSWGLGYRFYLRSYNACTMETVLYATAPGGEGGPAA